MRRQYFAALASAPALLAAPAIAHPGHEALGGLSHHISAGPVLGGIAFMLCLSLVVGYVQRRMKKSKLVSKTKISK